MPMPSPLASLTRLRRICRNAARIVFRRVTLLFTFSQTKQRQNFLNHYARLIFWVFPVLALVAIVIYSGVLQPPDQPPVAILPPTFNPDTLTSTTSSTNPPMRIILIIQPFSDSFNTRHLADLTNSLSSTAYDNDRVDLHVLLAPHANASSHATAYTAARSVPWPHGHRSVGNATSGGLYEQILSAWTPPPRARDAILLIDAAHTAPLSQEWYRYLKSARRRYHGNPDIAGFALEPVPVRARRFSPIGGSSTTRFVDEKVAEGGAGEDVFLYANLPLVSAFSPASPEIWRTFTRWFLAYRADWFLWPAVVSPRDKKDPSWNSYHGNERAHWSLWFSRFCAQYTLYTVYPRRARPAPLPPVGRVAAVPPLLRYSYDGTQAKPPDTVTADALSRIISLGRAQGGSVLLTVVNEAFVETARSWLCNVETAGFRPPGIVWIATDDAAYNALRDVRGSVAVRIAHFRGATARTGTSYGTPGYWLLMLERTTLIRDILDAGIGVFAFETDQIWLRDPVPFVRRVVRAGDEVDVVGTLDTRHEIGGNFLFLNPTLATRRLWREVARRFAKAYREQRMAHHTAKWRKYMENDQSTLTKLIFFDTAFKACNPIVFRALDTDLFVDGRWYDKQHKYYKSNKSRSPIMINNNFLIGIAKKKVRAIENGHWFYKDGKCDAALVQKAIADNEQRVQESDPGRAGATEPLSNVTRTNGRTEKPVRATRVEGGDVEAGLDAAIMAIGKEQIKV